MKYGFLSLILGLQVLIGWGSQEENVLRWAADAESGVPNVFFDPIDPNKITGFEYDIAQAIANNLGKPLKFFANDYGFCFCKIWCVFGFFYC